MNGIPWDTLPKTFQDAIMTADRLGCAYIWIDSLCIVQDGEQDWYTESSQMARIYENAVLTLAATVSPDSKGGLFSPPQPSATTTQMPDDGFGQPLFLRNIKSPRRGRTH